MIDHVTLITGGARSGKSTYALKLARSAERRLFVATAEPFDEEMRTRITAHKRERGDAFRTVEAPLDPASVIADNGGECDIAVLDCMTVWLGNLMHHHGVRVSTYPEVGGLLRVLEQPPCEVIVVTNELGLGLVPEHSISRRFRDMAGRLNQQVAAISSRVVFMISGIPLCIKEGNDGLIERDDRERRSG